MVDAALGGGAAAEGAPQVDTVSCGYAWVGNDSDINGNDDCNYINNDEHCHALGARGTRQSS